VLPWQKNILIFADGTGNEGGLLPDESRTNVYKLFCATRTGPDSPIDPAKQIAFYIPGVMPPTCSLSSFSRLPLKGTPPTKMCLAAASDQIQVIASIIT
jgi:hypothetical protein